MRPWKAVDTGHRTGGSLGDVEWHAAQREGEAEFDIVKSLEYIGVRLGRSG